MDPRTPVVAGVAELTQRVDRPDDGLGAVDLLTSCVEQAMADSGSGALAGRVGLIALPLGTWHHPDPARVLARRLGVDDATTVIADIGILQQSVLSRACAAVADGTVDVAVVAGVETKARDLLRARAGLEPDPSEGPPAGPGGPDEFLRPHGEIITAIEIERLLATPAHQYAMVEGVLAHLAGRSPDEQRAHVGRLWAAFAEVASRRDGAWERSAPNASAISEPDDHNRMIAVPYTRSMCSQWNVDQAAAVVICSAQTAEAVGVARDRWVFPLAAAESNRMVPMPVRATLSRWSAFGAVADAVFNLGGEALGQRIGIGDLDLVDLYSCFPAAVQVQATELGLDPAVVPTVTGGMTFGGGPLNSYQLHAVVELVRRLRGSRRAIALSTAVSGMLTKPGASLWSTEPPGTIFRSVDVSAPGGADAEPPPDSARRTVDPDLVGGATVVGATVVHQRDWPAQTVVLVETDDRVRTVATTDDAAVAETFSTIDWVGQTIEVVTPGRFALR